LLQDWHLPVSSVKNVCYNRPDMTEPLVIPRAGHTLSRREIDHDALKVLYRLHGAGHAAYLVGGSVRDLLLGRRPKDFDIGTSAHPYQIKRLFRNCWIIGRRFRLAHVKFGAKTIEVATFRRQVPPGTEDELPSPQDLPLTSGTDATDEAIAEADYRDRLIRRDNTFGTAEEDAFRRDFTINALFYDIGTFSIIDYVGGLADLRSGLLRSIGPPEERFLEDPVRMLRAIVMSSRLEFTIDPPVVAALDRLAAEITKSAPPRLLEEYFKILRSGAAARTFESLGASGLLRHLTPEVPVPLPAPLRRALVALDDYRRRFEAAPDTLTNAVLLGTLLMPIGAFRRGMLRRHDFGESGPRVPPSLGMLALPRRDLERLAQILAMQRRLLDAHALPRGHSSLVHRSGFGEALTWMEIHGDRPEVVAAWKARLAEDSEATGGPPGRGDLPARPRRRRRRRPSGN
jgi:poly(A) polymerase